MTRLFFGIGTAKPIHQPTDLRDYLPQKQRHHYRDGYSMAEAAKSWIAAGDRLPPSIANLVGTNFLKSAHFEYPVTVWGGGTSMTDILAFSDDSIITVEAKCRETFDDEVRSWIFREEERNPRSPKYRLEVINDQYAPAFGVGKDDLLGLRYQLLHRTLAAALVARQCGRSGALMVVQSFAPLDCNEHVRNRGDFDRYVALVGAAPVLKGIPVRLAWVDEPIDLAGAGNFPQARGDLKPVV